MDQASYGFAAEIDKCRRPGQQQHLASYFRNACSSPALPSVKANGVNPGEVIQALEANIVAITGVGLAGISQTNYEFH